MSDKYGLAAVDAVKKMIKGECENPRDAWDRALSYYFSPGTPAFKKGCPRSAFLGLCEEGFVKGIEAGNYTRSTKNKGYAIRAIKIIRGIPSIVNNMKYLWDETTMGRNIVHNSQMNVVIELYKNGLIKK